MQVVPLTKGKVTLVDDEDYQRVMAAGPWNAMHVVRKSREQWYAYRFVPRENGSRYRLYMHRFILEPPAGFETDHRNDDGLDNRRQNLRACTKAQNQHNQHAIRGKSKYRGVSALIFFLGVLY